MIHHHQLHQIFGQFAEIFTYPYIDKQIRQILGSKLGNLSLTYNEILEKHRTNLREILQKRRRHKFINLREMKAFYARYVF